MSNHFLIGKLVFFCALDDAWRSKHTACYQNVQPWYGRLSRHARLTVQNQYLAERLSLENTYILREKQEVAAQCYTSWSMVTGNIMCVPEIWIGPETAFSRLGTTVLVLSTTYSTP